MESQQLHSEVPAFEVANEFVRQYYCSLIHFPDDLYKFYKDCSTITRPESNGQILNIKTIQAIKEKVVPLNNEAKITAVDTVDFQEAGEGCYMILVTGVMLGHNNVDRKFVQSFFLAPQDTGLFILCDIFRFLGEPQYSEQKSMFDNAVASSLSDAQQSFPIFPAEEQQGFESQASEVEEEEGTEDVQNGQELQGSELQPSQLVEEEATEGVQNEQLSVEAAMPVQNEQLSVEGLIPREELIKGLESQSSTFEEEEADMPVQNEQLTVADLVPPHELQGIESEPLKLEEEEATRAAENEKKLITVEKGISPPEETTKMSFLSVLMKEKSHPIQRQAVVVKFPVNTRQKGNVPSQVQSTSKSLDINSTVKASNRCREASGNENSIHVRNLPWDITTSLLEKEFEKIGSIKPNGIQIRTNKEQGFCYGSIEFQSSTSMEAAIKASPIIICGRRVYVEKKRPSRIGDHFLPRKNNIPNNVKRGGVGQYFK